jgi:DNA-binding PadR family transcriptional regulator
LPATSWAVLGLLAFGDELGRELSGYDLKKWADASLRFFYWSPAISQIYGELKRLEAIGYAASREVRQDELRNKRVYRITASGLEALRRWARTAPVEPPVLKHGVALRAWLGHLATPEQLRDVVEQHRARCDEMLAEIRGDIEAGRHEPSWEYPVVVLRWSERYWASERRLADAMLRYLDEIGKKRRRR